ncbi:MAG: hypothetical protein RLZ45_35, partial [Verrucomicrobiota bacterium]
MCDCTVQLGENSAQMGGYRRKAPAETDSSVFFCGHRIDASSELTAPGLLAQKRRRRRCSSDAAMGRSGNRMKHPPLPPRVWNLQMARICRMAIPTDRTAWACLRSWIHWGGLVILFCCFCLQIPVSKAADTKPFLNSRWSERDGLPGGGILHLCEAPDGFLWACTKYGLRAFDGTRFFVPPGLEGLKDEAVQRVVFDGGGRAWLRGKGIVHRLEPQPQGGFRVETVVATDVVQDGAGWIWWQEGETIRGRLGDLKEDLPSGPFPGEDSPGLLPALWGGREGGVYRMDASGDLWRGTLRDWKRLPGPLSPGVRVRWCELFEDRRSRIWISLLTQSGQVLLFRSAGDGWVSMIPKQVTDPRLVRCFHETSAGEILAGADLGFLYRFSEAQPVPEVYRVGSPPEPIQAIHEDDLGNWWVGSEESGLRLISRESNVLLTQENPTGPASGASAQVPPIREIRERDPFPIQGITLDSIGRLWAAGGAQGLLVRDGDRMVVASATPPLLQGGHHVTVVASSPRGLVVGGGGVFMVLDHDGRLVPGHDHSAWLGTGSMIALEVDGNGGVWAGSDSGRLFHLPPETKKPEIIPVGSPVFDLAIEKDRVWMIAGKTLKCWQKGTWQPLPAELEMVRNPQSVFVDRRGRLLVVGTSEVAIWNGQDLAVLGARQGVFPGLNSKVLQDPQSRLWLATDAGILELNAGWIDQALSTGRATEVSGASIEAVGRVIHFSMLSEIHLTSKRAGAPIWTPSGEIALPSNKGVLLVRPRASDSLRSPAAVRISGIRTGSAGAFGDSLAMTNLCIPEGGELLVSLQRGLAATLLSPTIRYSISQDDRSWSYSQGDELLRIRHSATAAFPLRVQSKLSGGGWGGASTNWIEVDQSHRLSNAWRAAILGSFLLMGGLVGWQAYRSSLHQRRVRIRVLEGIQSDRIRIARSLHDDLGNRLSEIQLLTEQATFLFKPQ